MNDTHESNEVEGNSSMVEHPVHYHGAIKYFSTEAEVPDNELSMVEYPVHYHGAIKYFDAMNPDNITRTAPDVMELYGDSADTLGI